MLDHILFNLFGRFALRSQVRGHANRADGVRVTFAAFLGLDLQIADAANDSDHVLPLSPLSL
jgi:hypothetical protein